MYSFKRQTGAACQQPSPSRDRSTPSLPAPLGHQQNCALQHFAGHNSASRRLIGTFSETRRILDLLATRGFTLWTRPLRYAITREGHPRFVHTAADRGAMHVTSGPYSACASDATRLRRRFARAHGSAWRRYSATPAWQCCTAASIEAVSTQAHGNAALLRGSDPCSVLTPGGGARRHPRDHLPYAAPPGSAIRDAPKTLKACKSTPTPRTFLSVINVDGGKEGRICTFDRAVAPRRHRRRLGAR